MNIEKSIVDHKVLVDWLQNDEATKQQLVKLVEQAVKVFNNGGRLLFCGNGGSAADAQHLAAELSGRFYLNRKALDAEALHVNSSYITAVGNDFDFNQIYERAIEAKGREGDMLIALSTSGESKNIINACIKAQEIGLFTAGFTGKVGESLDKVCNLTIHVPSVDTPRIQELHLLMGHIFCEQVEASIFAT